ncbi:transporter substrate-binding domain-containing protein [Bacteriovoracales bacterium]|nr:transporter substrate-binding domain-containing protein [Bacteriovoracales bacterium]
MKYLIFIFLIFSTRSAFSKNQMSVACEDFIPHTGKKLKNFGWTVDVLRQALKEVNYDLKYSFMPWARAVKITKRGDFDGLYLAYMNDERKKHYYFSDPIGSVVVSLHGAKSLKFSYNSVKDLRPYKFAVVRKAAHEKEFDQAKYLKKREVTSYSQGIRMLVKGRVDFFVSPEKIFQYNLNLLKEEPVINSLIKSTLPVRKGKPLKKNNMYLAISKKSKKALEKLNAFNKGLRIIKKNGKFQKILKDHGF